MTTTPDSNAAVKFLAELVNRLFSKTPWFFKVIQIVSGLTVLVAGLPGFLETIGIPLPAALTLLESKVVAISAIVSLFISSLPVVTSATTPPAALPFTASKETK